MNEQFWWDAEYYVAGINRCVSLECDVYAPNKTQAKVLAAAEFSAVLGRKLTSRDVVWVEKRLPSESGEVVEAPLPTKPFPKHIR